MTLIIIIAAILLERFWPEISLHQNKKYFSVATNYVLEKLPENIKSQPLLFLLVLLAVPFVVVLLINLILLNILDGLFALPVNVLILLICVKTSPRDEMIDAYITAQQAQDNTAIAETFQDITGENVKSVVRPNSYITRFLLLANVSRWFSIIFYFVLLGPAGVIAYRTLHEFIQRGESSMPLAKLAKLKDYMEWPVTRLMALTLCLSGSFDDALRGWQQQTKYQDKNDPLVVGAEMQQSNTIALLSTGCAAIGHEMQKPKHNDTAFILAVKGMLFRTLMIWCATIAFLTLLTDVII